MAGRAGRVSRDSEAEGRDLQPLAWADGDISPQTLTDLSSPGAQSLIVRFNPTARGAVLEI